MLNNADVHVSVRLRWLYVKRQILSAHRNRNVFVVCLIVAIALHFEAAIVADFTATVGTVVPPSVNTVQKAAIARASEAPTAVGRSQAP